MEVLKCGKCGMEFGFPDGAFVEAMTLIEQEGENAVLCKKCLEGGDRTAYFCPRCRTETEVHGWRNDPPRCPKCGRYMLPRGVTWA